MTVSDSTPSIPYVAERPRKNRWGRWVLLFFLTLLVAVVALGVWQSMQSAREYESACALADAQDPLWRLTDAAEQRKAVPPNQDIVPFVVAAAQKLPAEWPLLSAEDFSQVLLGGDTIVTRSNPNPRANPGNLQLQPRWLDNLKKNTNGSESALALSRDFLNFPKGNFPIVTDWKSPASPVNSAFARMVEAQRQRAILEWIAGSPSAWNHLAIAQHLISIYDEPSISSLVLHNSGHQRLLIALEWMLGQREPSDADMGSFMQRLGAELKNNSPIKNSFRWHRAFTDKLLRDYRNDDPELKKTLGVLRYVMGTTLYCSVAECIRTSTEGIDKANLPLADFLSWFEQSLARFSDRPSDFLGSYPYTFYCIYLLPRIKKTIHDYYEHQERLRLAIAALACERYRLRHQRFPKNPQDLQSILGQELWDDLFGPKTFFKLYLHQTTIGMVVTSLDSEKGPEDPKDWETRVSMQGPYASNIKMGFRLYQPALRGKPAAPEKPRTNE